MAGLTPTGFQSKTLEEIKAELEADLRARIGSEIDLSTESPTGQLVGIMAGQLRKLWELAEEVHANQYPDSASGFGLVSLSVLTGTKQEAAKPSTVLCTVNVNPGTYAALSLVAHVLGDPTRRFRNRADVVNGGGGPANIAGQLFESEETGPIRADNGTLTVIAEPVAGWNAIINTADATLGSDIESDAALRTRREEELARRGSTTVDAIRVDVLDVLDVVSCTVLENDTDETVNGIPPHSVEALVRGGTDQAVADAIFFSKAGGPRAFGSTTMTVVDSQGIAHQTGFTRPTEIPIYINTTLATNEDYIGDTAVEQALVDFADADWVEGRDVLYAKLVGILISLEGVEDVLALTIGTAPAPVGVVNIPIGMREVATLDTANINVTS